MQTTSKPDLFFYLTGKRLDGSLSSVEGLELRPALFARLRDLAELRYDFPLVLMREDGANSWVESLSGLFNRIVDTFAQDAEDARLTKHALRLEREIRTLAAKGATGSLSTLRDAAATRLMAESKHFEDSLKRLRALLPWEGEVMDCDRAAPARLFRHAWEGAQRKKARNFHERVDSLILQLSDILRADSARAEEGLSARSLRASFGEAYAEAFDFEAMSRVLASTTVKGLEPERARRMRWILSVLRSQKFFPADAKANSPNGNGERYSFAFESGASALEAYRERLPEMIEFAKAVAMASLEVSGEYLASVHDLYFEDFRAANLDPATVALFPDYFVHVNASSVSHEELNSLGEALTAGLPLKVLLQTDDLLAPAPFANGDLTLDSPRNRLASSMIATGKVYVLQSTSSNLFRFRDRIYQGMAFAGPALFSVFSGAAENTSHLPAYLVAAAAMESRAFPAFAYDPAAGPDWASRFHVQENPQPEADWPVHPLTFEDEGLQKGSDNLPFTPADFLACDRRIASKLAKVPRAAWNESLIPLADFLADETEAARGRVPYVLMVDAGDTLQKVIVGEGLVRESRHCLDGWRSLQELGGIHNSHAERLLAQERRLWEDQLRREKESQGKELAPVSAAPASVPVAVAPSPPQAEEEAAAPSGEAYIETARCTSCDECIKLNGKMFAYNSEKQAAIANLEAGTYRQLVEAAENCPVAIIHPGKPRNPQEPGIEELLKRAAPFL